MKNMKLTLCIFLFISLFLTGCGDEGNENKKQKNENIQNTEQNITDSTSEAISGDNQSDVELFYAREFTVEDYEDCKLITIGGRDKFLVVPENTGVPSCPEDVVILKQPLVNGYLVSSSAMDLVCSIGAIDNITLTGTREDEWYVEAARTAMEEGKLFYAGKYNTPDYELILDNMCDIAIENTMIYHNPQTMEKLEELGVPVLVERSSYETDPRGRLEWIKLYGVLFDREDEAARVFDEAMKTMEGVLAEDSTGKTVAYFYITGNGAVSVRKSKDYIAKLIGMAGGKYIFDHLDQEDENALSTVNMQVEEFYASAKEADVLIYNSTIAGELEDIDSLIALCPVLSDFKAIKNGDVYCTSNNFFQRTCSMAEFTVEVNQILKGSAKEQMEFLYKLH